MPTYAYACDSCGFAKDEWLKVSEALPELTCPSCGKPTYRKQLTAPAFQLKGSGWYVTDFRQNGAQASANQAAADTAPPAANAAPAPASSPAAAPASAPAAPSSTGSS